MEGSCGAHQETVSRRTKKTERGSDDLGTRAWIPRAAVSRPYPLLCPAPAVEYRSLLTTAPISSLSVYEIKLRDFLGLRKRLRKKEYPIIHSHARSEGWETYNVYLNGTLIPWEKYWKEYRRSGAKNVIESKVES